MMAGLTTILIFILAREIGVHAGVTLPVGGLFNSKTIKESIKVFDSIVPSSSVTNKPYHGRSIYPDVLDSYSTALHVCKNTSSDEDGDHGIVALLDARPSEGICDTICLLCNALNITQLTVGWQPTETMENDLFTFSYYPSPRDISKAFAKLIDNLGWDRFTIFYEDDGSFIRLQELINSWPVTKPPIIFRKLEPGGNNREVFKDIFQSGPLSHHVIDCDPENLMQYMQQITEVENSTMYQSFVLTNLDSHIVNLSQVEMMANVSTMHMIIESSRLPPTKSNDPDFVYKLESALTVDALKHLGIAIADVMEKDPEELMKKSNAFAPIPPICFQGSRNEYSPWLWGDMLRQTLINVTIGGATGDIQLNERGERTNFKLHYAKLNTESKFVHAGIWESKTNVITFDESVLDRSASQKTGEITMVSKKGKPYFMIHTDLNETDTNLLYYGYAVDLATKIVEEINKKNGTDFKLKFREVADGTYGNRIEGTKKWTGIIGELMEHKADIAICDLTITSERNTAVDFSTPFMSTGISMLFKVPDPVTPDMFSFINPLSLDVWLYLATTYILVSFVLLICARMSQADWVNPHPCNQNPEKLENIWSLYNCMWLTMGTIMTQGCDILPRGIGSRWITGLWWFFAMIVTASYTANMSTFLSNSRRTNEIKNIKELSEQTKVRYGAVVNASTYKFFQESDDPVYQKIWQVMSTAQPDVFTNSNDDGKERVLKGKGNYVFFMESTAIKYYTERNCMLKMVGGQLDSKSYGIAMPKNSPYKSLIDSAILSLQESGQLSTLYREWWIEWKDEDYEKCEIEEEAEDDGSLQMKNTSGIFLVLGVGGILGFITAIVDFMMHAWKISVKENVTFKEALASEWRASLDPRSLAKPAAPPRSAPPSSGTPSPERVRSQSRAVSVLRAATSFINFDEIY